MNQSASKLLITVLLGAVVFGLVVLLSVPDYREGKILETNRAYMPAVRIENVSVPLPTPQPEADAADAAPAGPGATPMPPEAAP
jgi:hypothetical protein